ncbi:pre-mRNA splicing factor [Favolaschia claudopus]|uniref:RNA helicase n=1 Tax=Favolaschia claudopus TaxID=2862362 RepID=A0AAW0D5W1_9AGAR
MSSELERYISDNSLRLFGLADRKIIDYVLASASSSKTPESLFTALNASGLPDTPDAHEFINEVFRQAPRKHKHKRSAADSARRQAEKEAQAFSSQKFGFLLDDDAASNDVMPLKKDKRRKEEKEKSSRDKRDRHTRKREHDEKEWESDEEEKARKRRRADEDSYRAGDYDEEMEDVEDEEARKERERLEDLKDRDAFAERVRDRDKEKTKKIVEDRSSKDKGAAAEAAQRRALADDTEARILAMPSLRQHSRQEYLTKREIQQIELLRKEIADDEVLFSGMKISKRERRELEHKKELLKLVEERLKINDKYEGYQLPEDYLTEQGKIDKKKKENALYQRYEEAKPKDDQFVTDVDQWEASQTRHSTFKSGALDKEEVRDDYEYVFDESQTIKFVMDTAMPGKRMTAAEKLLQDQLDAAEKRAKTIEETRKSLPIYTYKEQLIEAVKEHQVLIVVAETGSGKTTQLPQYLHEAGFTANGQKVGCTQPRRVAAMSVAARVADEMGTKVGYEVGYSIRFEDCTSDKTVLKYMTDGMLLREFLTEPDLAGYSALIIDEAHERTLSTDILFALVKDIARFRPELRLLISSATLDAEKFSEYFDNAPTFYVPGRQFAVDIHYTPQPEANYLHAAITTVFQIHTTQPKGDILVFLTGQEEIEACHENLQETSRALGNKIAELIICPIYANLPSEMQAKIFEPTPEGARKVVLATNIAETSITIDGVVFVIDPGFVKQNSYNPRTGMSSLVVVPCSRASANQRAGRAGRVGPGKAFRLYTKWAFANELESNTVPEIQRTNLGMTVLMLKSLGINDLIGFEFLDPPPGETLMRALELLYALGALNDRGELTKLGRRMAEFPVDPMLSKAIISSEKYVCTDEVLTIISMLSESGSLFYRPKDKKLHADQARQNFVRPGGDHFTLLNIWEQWAETNYSQQFCYEQFLQFKSISRARDIRDQLAGLCERVEVVVESNPNSNDITPIQKALTSGYFYNTAQLQKSGDSYRTLKTNHTVYIHPSSSLFQFQPPVKTVLYYELVMTSKSYMRQIMEIKPAWLLEVAPHYFKPADLEQLATGDKKMPNSKAVGSSSAPAPYATTFAFDDEELDGQPAAGPSRKVTFDEDDSESDFAPEKEPSEAADPDEDEPSEDASGADESLDADDDSVNADVPARASKPRPAVAVKRATKPKAPPKAKKAAESMVMQRTTGISLGSGTIARTSKRQIYILPTPSVHHRHKAVPLYLKTARVERLTSKPVLFGPSQTTPTNNFTHSAAITGRINRAWGMNVGAGPIWDLAEDRGWFKEGGDVEDEASRRPFVHQNIQVKPGLQILSLDEATPYLPTDTITTDEGNLKPPPPVSCSFGPFGQQHLVDIPMFESRKNSEFIPESSSHIFNPGAPAWGLDWCPINSSDRQGRSFTQYIAVAPLSTASHSPDIGVKVKRPAPACIQIWTLSPSQPGTLSKNDRGVMRCALVLCIDSGPAQDLKWCPLPSHDSINDKTTRPRKLGLIAGTFEDGSFSIFVVPEPLDVTPAGHDLTKPVFVRISEPLIRIDLEETACWSFDWANSELVAIGTTHGIIAVYHLGQVLKDCSGPDPALPTDILPTHYLTVHQSAIRAIAWVRAPPSWPSGAPRLDGDPTVICSGGYDGLECLTDIREGHCSVMNRTRDVINAMTYSPFGGGPITIDHENIVKVYSVSPSMLGRGHILMEPQGPIWSLNASDYHPQLAVGSADGACSTTNALRSTRRGGSVPFFVHKLYQLDYSRNTKEFRMLERFLPQEAQDRPTQTKAVRAEKAKGRDFTHMAPTSAGAWPTEVGVQRVVWNCGNGIAASGLLASSTASGLCRVDVVWGRWLNDRIPYNTIGELRMEGAENDAMDEDSDESE